VWSPHRAFFLLHKECLRSLTFKENLCAPLHFIEDVDALGYVTLIIGTVVTGISEELSASIFKVQPVQVEWAILRLTQKTMDPSDILNPEDEAGGY
jgi:hypothetical protein